MAPQERSSSVHASEGFPNSLKAGKLLVKAPPGEEIVISGLAGAFPDSANVYHFQNNLFNKVDLVSDDDRRWKIDHPDIPQKTGKLLTINKFDTAFFGIHYKQAEAMEPMGRILLEKVYEAIVDAGINPQELKGTNTGVIAGICFSETEKTWFFEKFAENSFGVSGCNRAMLVSRISHWLGINGPTYVVDSACSSSIYAVEHAYKAIREGLCDRAIVAASNLCLHPFVSMQFTRLGVLSPDGRCKCFDNNANGYARSEAACAAFLQKQKEARRIYATVLHAKTNCDGYKEQGITYPSGEMQKKLLEEFYEEVGMDPRTIDYVEAHGTGTEVGDPEELNALSQVFCPGRTTPLKIGSVKSNMGHSEPVSGLCSITKAIIAMETGFIPPNIGYKNPKRGVPALKNGQLKVVTEKQPFNGELIGVNSFGFGGANAHVLLRWNTKHKVNGGTPLDLLPRLVVVSGRTKGAVKTLLKELENHPIDAEYVQLFHDIHKLEIPGHFYRGYTLLHQKHKFSHLQYYPGTKRPVWFLFTGIGTHWHSMGKSLMLIPAFASVIEKFDQVLAPHGINIVSIITSEDLKIFDNIQSIFVAITAMQVGMANILKTVGITPNGMVGCSLGELGCAYVDGSLTAEQTALAAYFCGQALLECTLARGSMAVVGLGAEQTKQVCPMDVEIVCHDGSQFCTVSGPTGSITHFIEMLKQKGIFTKKINSANIAYHNKHIASVGPILLSYLKKVISTKKSRSKLWTSASIPENEWDTPLAKSASAEYYTNNLLSPVFFEEACQHIPDDAITIEISPHGIFEPTLQDIPHKSITNVKLMEQGHHQSVEMLLCALGKLYELGLQPQLANLYPAVQYPVSRGTPMISPLIRWDHSEDWFVMRYHGEEKAKAGERSVLISVAEEDMEFYSGHVIDGRNLFPATGYLQLVWETLGYMQGKLHPELSVVFENVHFHRATTIPKEGSIEFTVMIQRSSGKFEVAESGAAVVKGTITSTENPVLLTADLDPLEPVMGEDLIAFSSKDIYKELCLRGYNYNGLFRSLVHVESNGHIGKLRWRNNWVAFIDNMLQIQILQEDTRALFVPVSIKKLTIATKHHMHEIQQISDEEKDLTIYVYKDLGIIRCGGVEVKGLNASAIAKRKPLGEPVLEKHVFIANKEPDDPTLDLAGALRVCMHIALENQLGIKVKTVELVDNEHESDKQILSPILTSILGDLPLIQADITILSNAEHPAIKELNPSGYSIEDRKLAGESNSMLVMVSNILHRSEVLQTALKILDEGACILAREKNDVDFNLAEESSLSIIFEKKLAKEKFILLKKSAPVQDSAVVHINDNNYKWLAEAQRLLSNTKSCVIFVAQGEPFNGILGLFNCIRKESGGNYARCFLILDKSAPKFEINLAFYKEQLQKDLAVNVFKDGKWGTYRHLPLICSSIVSVPHAYAAQTIRGDLTTFRWLEGSIDPKNPKLMPWEKLAHVYYSAVNFRDVMLSTGKISPESIGTTRLTEDVYIGLEFSGRDANGERVMGMTASGGLSTVAVADSEFLWKVPDHWSLEEAATVPVVYSTVYFAFLVGKLKKGDIVLIHAGSGGVGQAAINICLHAGCTVFTTVGTQEKRDFIKRKYPKLTDRHIGNSRDTSFEQLIMSETGGRGVDIVLNSLAEEKLQASLRCLAIGGRFLEIGKYDMVNNNPLGLDIFQKNTSFHGIMLDTLFSVQSEWKKVLHNLLQEGIKSGAVQPLNRTVFAENEIEQAFRFMAGAKHMGKVLIKVREEEPEKSIVMQPHLMQATPQYLCHPDFSYIILGGLGGFGLELADWLVLRGARKLVLSSRTGLRTGYQSSRVRTWRSYGVSVHISTADITTEEGIKQLLQHASSLGQVDAIFNLAVVLQDGLFENQTEGAFVASAGPKADATRHLDKMSRIYCPNLRNFVVFSSVSCGRGNLGQTNYGLSNSVMERICEARVEEDLPGLAIQWGAVGEVGLVADMQEEETEAVIGGTLPQRISSCLKELDKFMKQPHPVVASMVVAEKLASGSGSNNPVDCVCNILGIRDLKVVSLQSTLAEVGMDSMMSVEIKQSLERDFNIYLTPKEIRSLTFSRLVELSTTNEGDRQKCHGIMTTETQDNELEGMQLVFRVAGDEKTSLMDVVQLPSLIDSGTDIKNIPQAAPILFMIPGVEGMASALAPLAANLKYQTICLQLGYQRNSQSIQELALGLLPLMQSRLDHDEPFALLGYSYGGIVAMELAHMLEAQGRDGQLFLIDSAPDFVRLLAKQALGTDSEDEIQIKLICHCLRNLNPKEATTDNFEKIFKELKPLKSWEERSEHFLRMGFAPEGVNNQHHKAVGNAMYTRHMSTLNYEWHHKNPIKASVTLLRPTSASVIHPEDDYGLSKYCEQKVNVHVLNGNHITILDNIEAAKIINDTAADSKIGSFKDTLLAEHNANIHSQVFAKSQ